MPSLLWDLELSVCFCAEEGFTLLFAVKNRWSQSLCLPQSLSFDMQMQGSQRMADALFWLCCVTGQSKHGPQWTEEGHSHSDTRECIDFFIGYYTLPEFKFKTFCLINPVSQDNSGHEWASYSNYWQFLENSDTWGNWGTGKTIINLINLISYYFDSSLYMCNYICSFNLLLVFWSVCISIVI